jgi:hypothetical protein
MRHELKKKLIRYFNEIKALERALSKYNLDIGKLEIIISAHDEIEKLTNTKNKLKNNKIQIDNNKGYFFYVPDFMQEPLKSLAKMLITERIAELEKEINKYLPPLGDKEFTEDSY